MYKRSSTGWSKHLDFIVFDMLSLQIAFILGYCIRHGFDILPYFVEEYRSMGVMLAVLDLLVCIAFNTMHGVLRRGLYNEFIATTKQVVAVMGSATVFLFVARTSIVYSRTTIICTTLFYLVISYSIRLLWKHFLRTHTNTASTSSIIVVANSKQLRSAIQAARTLQNRNIVGAVCTNAYPKGKTCDGVPIVCALNEAALYICREWVDEVFVYNAIDLSMPASVYENGTSVAATSGKESKQIDELILHCREMGVTVHLRLPISRQSMSGRAFLEESGKHTVLTISNNYMTPRQAFLKRLLDIIGGIVGSMLAILIMATVGVAIIVKSPGPMLFKQTRIGLNGKRFTMYKLRSMYIDAEERKQELMEQNRISNGLMFKLNWDPRIIGNQILPDGTKRTGIGEFVRKTSLDEFPQFFNVLKGDMSLVGTRPPTVDEWEQYEFHHRARLAAKPGITGLWQVSGRSQITDFEEVVRLDTEYIQSWSMGLDLRILFKTVGAVFKHEGAM